MGLLYSPGDGLAFDQHFLPRQRLLVTVKRSLAKGCQKIPE